MDPLPPGSPCPRGRREGREAEDGQVQRSWAIRAAGLHPIRAFPGPGLLLRALCALTRYPKHCQKSIFSLILQMRTTDAAGLKIHSVFQSWLWNLCFDHGSTRCVVTDGPSASLCGVCPSPQPYCSGGSGWWSRRTQSSADSWLPPSRLQGSVLSGPLGRISRRFLAARKATGQLYYLAPATRQLNPLSSPRSCSKKLQER